MRAGAELHELQACSRRSLRRRARRQRARQRERRRRAHAGDEHGEGDADGASDAGNPNVNSCMCCFYWVTRRQKHKVVQMPMQTLLWFVRTLRWCHGSKCDSRILLRLVNTVTQPDNMYAHLFDASELLGMTAIQQQAQAASKQQHYPGGNAVRRQGCTQRSNLFITTTLPQYQRSPVPAICRHWS